ncbi:hypothetical protein O3P69_009164 [Scylla paramamosain]|uniref:Mutator-like transposase domain-containing protein n=1 Tax=Scylla paramamosain TaxID=85552 RepID=A0AAW0TA53_SCYPA
MTRGHKSHVGAGFIIEAHTGIIIDYEVLCNYCNTCQLNKQHRDGDSSAYNAVCTQNNGRSLYDNVTVVKEECLNHVGKRLGSRLRKMKNEVATYKQTKTGKWRKQSSLGSINMLTDTVINKLQQYYSMAIRSSVGTDNLYLAKIPYEKLEYIKLVYRDLTAPHLLQRCLRGRTQNPNESLHSKVWQKCPKVKFAV